MPDKPWRVDLLRIALDGPDTYWVEVRPAEGGPEVIVRHGPDGVLEDVTPPGFSVGSMVNECGTRSYTVADGVVYFSTTKTNGCTVIGPTRPRCRSRPRATSGTAAI